jgi:elongation of very long chain fatty acids protein 4
MAGPLLAHADRAIAALSEAIQHAANPALPAAARATAGWPVMSLHAALGWCAAYGALVAYGLAVRPAPGPDGKRVSPKNDAVEAVVKPLMLAYNAAQVLLCGWMIVAVLAEARAVGVAVSLATLVCNPFRPAATGIARVLWVFYLSKILDFLDTVFFVARGKWEQMSFLHVYHHFSIFLTYWLVTAVGYDGDVYYTVVANSFVHFVMVSSRSRPTGRPAAGPPRAAAHTHTPRAAAADAGDPAAR